MSSIVSICNRALTKLGANRITSLDDNVKGARVMSSMYDSVRRAEIRSHRWSFALARTSLPALSAAPAWGFKLQYQLPADFLRLDQLEMIFAWFGDLYRWSSANFDTALYAVEGGKILTNLPAPLNVRYARDINDPNLFDATFEESLACKLAIEACEDLTQSSTKKGDVKAEYDDAIKSAIRVNAIERPPQQLAESEWIIARL
ncbi:hypothetical protein [Burkholderia gladioli]|uniref:hypothetical protein n=1 Tax=Burkholderia gladioli TaxID=28095 RepID=UPI0015E726C8|nr:hypothetical protein [Burkholderia gladioli]MBA1364044.1 hypothetical protein [Burkholderia gladioli]